MIYSSYFQCYGIRLDFDYLDTITGQQFITLISNLKNTPLNDLIEMRNNFKNSKYKKNLSDEQYLVHWNNQLEVKKGIWPVLDKIDSK